MTTKTNSNLVTRSDHTFMGFTNLIDRTLSLLSFGYLKPKFNSYCAKVVAKRQAEREKAHNIIRKTQAGIAELEYMKSQINLYAIEHCQPLEKISELSRFNGAMNYFRTELIKITGDLL